MPSVLTNPVVEFHLAPSPEDPAGVVAVATFVGDDGQQVVMRFTQSDAAGLLAARSFRCAMDLQAARSDGATDALRTVEVPADGEPLTVHEYLRFHQVRAHFHDPGTAPPP